MDATADFAGDGEGAFENDGETAAAATTDEEEEFISGKNHKGRVGLSCSPDIFEDVSKFHKSIDLEVDKS